MDIRGGYGMFCYSTDRNSAGTEVTGGEDWLAWINADDGTVDLWHYDTANGGAGKAWQSNEIDLRNGGAETGQSCDGIFTYIDGALRVADAHRLSAFQPMWYGHINRDLFGVGNYVASDWYSQVNDLAKPHAGNAYDHNGTIPTTGSAGVIHVKFKVVQDDEIAEVSWQKEWQVAVSYVYDTHQESLLRILTNTVDYTATTDLAKVRFELAVIGSSGTKIGAKRITGAKLYIRELGKVAWLLQGVYDFTTGAYQYGAGEKQSWSFTAGSPGYYSAHNAPQAQLLPEIGIDYDAENGFSADNESIDVGQPGDGYKTACVVNRSMYIMNVKRTGADGKQWRDQDGMYKSPVGKFDTFPLEGRIKVKGTDGEEIIRGVGFADRILQFKQETMYIINAQGDNEFLESEHPFKGVKNGGAVAEADFGVIWVNEFGLFWYNGERVINLLERKDENGKKYRLIDDQTWKDFTSDNSCLGYHPLHNYAIITRSSTAWAGRCYVYDFKTHSIAYGKTKFTDNRINTNFTVDHNGELLVVESEQSGGTTGKIYKWVDDDASITSSDMDIEFRDETFDALGYENETFEVILTYKASAIQNNVLRYYQNGEYNSHAQYSSGDLVADTTKWNTVTCNPTAPIKNKSIQFKLDLNSVGRFWLNDMSVTRRILPASRV
jgi:hypothetical protein